MRACHGRAAVAGLPGRSIARGRTPERTRMHCVHTIGYEDTTVARFLATLAAAGVELVVDSRAVAGSRRPGFAKTNLAASLAGAGMEYLHLRGLGTPADGRVAARAGRHAEMKAIFESHMETSAFHDDLERLEAIVRSGRRVALLCLEADPTHCHRSMVANALAERTPIRIVHLRPDLEE